MPTLDTHDIDVVTGAIYFIVGRGTEGGSAPYHLTIAGVTVGKADPHWDKTERVRIDSGYSLGTIQVDLGKRGTWALGSTKGTALKPGEVSYVDAIINESAKFANDHGLKFAADKAQLRADLLTHGNGQDVASALVFIDEDTRDSINAWASSEGGQQWIHKNIDYPQVRHATKSAMESLDRYGKNVPEDRRLEAIAILAKTENQLPAKVKALEKVLEAGGNYEDLLAEAVKLKVRYGSYDGLKAANTAEKYKIAYQDLGKSAALDRAQAKVGDPDFNPSTAAADADFHEALRAIGQYAAARVLRQGSRGAQVTTVQTDLARLGITDAHGRALHPDGAFGPSTQAAVETFQRTHGLKPDGLVGPETLSALHDAARLQPASLADSTHPGHRLFCQALQGVYAIDAKHGRAPDGLSGNLAGSLATAARAHGLDRIDHVLLGDGAKQAFAVQGDLRSPFKQVACVDVIQAAARPLLQSSVEFHTFSPLPDRQPAEMAQQQQSLAQPPSQGVLR